MVTLLNFLCTPPNQSSSGRNPSIKFIQPDREILDAVGLSGLVAEDVNAYQVLHGLPFRNNLFTIVVPPHWTSHRQYTSLINGFYDLNQNLVEMNGPTMFKILQHLYVADGFGAIGILWNGGGALASRTMNNSAYVDLNDFLKILLPVLKLDPKKSVTYGVSRGGDTALNIASHPAIDQLRVSFAYAAVPPSDLDYIASVISPTIPESLPAVDWSTGYVSSWANDFKMPGTTLSGLDQLLLVLSGSKD